MLSFAEKSVSACFLLLILLWIGRDPQFLPGFGDLFAPGYFTDGTSAMLVSIALFLLPAECPSAINDLFRKSTNKSTELESVTTSDEALEVCAGAPKNCAQKSPQRLMDWPTMQKQFPVQYRIFTKL